MRRKIWTVAVICILMLMSLPTVIGNVNEIEKEDRQSSIPLAKGSFADEFIIRCGSPYILAAFNLEYFYDIPVEELQVLIDFNIEKLDGTVIYENPYDYIDKIPPRFGVTWCIGILPELIESKFYFGILKINVDLYVLDDDSHQYRTFYGLYVFPHLKIVYLGQFLELILL